MKPRREEENRIAVFVKAPVPGQVKTRLCPPLSAAQAATLYAAFVADTLKTARSVAGASAAVCYAAAGGFPDLGWLQDEPAPPFFLQRGAGLGQKLQACFGDVFAAGGRKAVAIGSDTPHLSAGALREAFALLDANDLVLGPAADGGYYLIGLKAPADSLFEGVSWSTPQVLGETVLRAGRAGLRVGYLPELFDVDTAADLEELKRECARSGAAPATREALRALRGEGAEP